MKILIELLMLIGWIAGIVLAKGFLLTLLAIVAPIYGWYLVIEKIMIMNGWL